MSASLEDIQQPVRGTHQQSTSPHVLHFHPPSSSPLPVRNVNMRRTVVARPYRHGIRMNGANGDHTSDPFSCLVWVYKGVI